MLFSRYLWKPILRLQQILLTGRKTIRISLRLTKNKSFSTSHKEYGNAFLEDLPDEATTTIYFLHEISYPKVQVWTVGAIPPCEYAQTMVACLRSIVRWYCPHWYG